MENIKTFFLSEPQSKNYYTMEISEEKIYDTLINVYLNGMNILFGSKCNPINITNEQFNLLNKYMMSIGYIVEYKKDDTKLDIIIKKC